MRPVPQLVALSLLLAFFGLGGFFPHGFGAQSTPVTPTSGYAAYSVTIAPQGNASEVFVLNETVHPTTGNGMVQITLLLAGNSRHLEYSKELNASSVPEVFPYLFGLNNQSLRYSTSGVDIEAHIVHTGQTTVSFNGKAYQGESYAASITVTSSSISGANYSFSGSIVTMPSSVIYSVNFHSSGQAALTVQLIGTNLPLTSIQQSGTSTLLGFALVGLGLLGAAAVAVPSLFAIVRVRMAKPKHVLPVSSQDKKPVSNDKPEYWVD